MLQMRFVLLLLALAAAPVHAALEVEITGVEGAVLENVQLRLGIRTAAQGDDAPDEATVRRLHAQAPSEIRSALQVYGYYQPIIRSELSGSAPDWLASYRIEPGIATVITRVEIRIEGEAASFELLNKTLARVAPQQGEVLRHARYEEAKAALAQAAYAEGFLDARYTLAELRVSPQAHSAEIWLTLDSGPRWYFGDVTVEQEGLQPALIARYVPLRPGEPFRPQQLLDTQFALSDLDYFQAVELLPQREQAAEGRIPVLIRTTPRPKVQYKVGAGYGTDTGARLSLGSEFRRLNRHGHKLRADLRFSEVKDSLGGEYRIPLGRRTGESLSFSGASILERFDTGDSLKYTLGVALSRTPGDWQRRLYLSFEHEESDLGGVEQTSDLLIPGISFSRNVADDAIYTRRGWSLFFDVHGAQKGILGNTSFLQTRALARFAYPLGARSRLMGRAEFGANFVEEFSELPASQRFFAGGDQSVRGYGYQSLGPRDANNLVVGGEFLSTYSLEAETRVWNNWGAAVFFDAGGADDDPNPRLFQGVGAGVRYRAPVGNLSLDLAHPLNSVDDGVRVHIGVRVGL